MFADVPGPQDEDGSGEIAELAALYGVQQILREFFPHALEEHKVFPGEGVDVGHVLYQRECQQLFDEFFAQTVDVHGASGGEVLEPFPQLCGTGRAPRNAPPPLRGCAPPLRRNRSRSGVWGARSRSPVSPRENPDHGGDHVPGALHDDGVTLADVLSLHLFPVV